MSSRISLPNKLISHKSCSLTLGLESSTPKHTINTYDTSHSPASRQPSQSLHTNDPSSIARQRAQVQHLALKCHEQNKCIKELEQYIDELEHSNRQKGTIIQRLSNQNQTIRQENQYLKQQIRKFQPPSLRRDRLQDEGQACHKQQQKENQSSNCESVMMSEQVHKLTHRLNFIKQQNQSLKTQVQKLKADYEREKKIVEVKEQQVQELQTRATFEKNKKEREIDGLKSQLRLKQAELDKMASLHGVLEGERQRRDRLKSEERLREREQFTAIRNQWAKEIEKMESIFHSLPF